MHPLETPQSTGRGEAAAPSAPALPDKDQLEAEFAQAIEALGGADALSDALAEALGRGEDEDTAELAGAEELVWATMPAGALCEGGEAGPPGRRPGDRRER